MSRVGIKPVEVPTAVQVTVEERHVTAKGPKGELSYEATEEVEISMEDSAIVVKPRDDSQKARAMWGTTRARIANLVEGVSEGFTRRLGIAGVGYRASVQGTNLNLQLGFSHDVIFPIPEGIQIRCETPTSIEISGADKQQVGQVAAKIRGFRPPEPYKGKGVHYADEYILRKEGKKK